MSYRLNRVRAGLLFMVGLLAAAVLLSGCGVVVRGVVRGGNEVKNSALFHQGRHGELTERERKWAEVAWSYFENNYNEQTGLVNSVDRYPYVTMWDVADYLAALFSARELEIIKRCTFDARLSRLISFLNRMDLFFGKLPNKAYNTRTGKMVDYANQPQEIGWSAVDIGRLLVWLNIIKARYPSFAEYIDKAVLRWSFCEVVDDCGTLFGGAKVHDRIKLYQEGRLGHEEYAAKGFKAWGFDTSRASRIEPSRKIRLYGIEIPCDARDPRQTGAFSSLVSLGFLLDGIEFNWDRVDDRMSLDTVHTDRSMARIAEAVYRVQEARYYQEHILTARTDHPLPEAPFFVYDSIFAAGYPWNVITDSGQHAKDSSIVATKAAFGMWALWNTRYTERLMDAVGCLFDPERGWFEGRWEKTGGYVRTVSCATNAVVLESLLYKKNDKLFRPGKEKGVWEKVTADPFTPGGKCFPRERQDCQRR
jgi:hypothetical protein